MTESPSVRLPQTVYDCTEDIQEEYGYPSLGEAARHVFQEAGYDV